MSVEQRLERIEALLQTLVKAQSQTVSSSIDIDLCLRADNPLAALRERNKKLKQQKGRARSATGSS